MIDLEKVTVRRPNAGFSDLCVASRLVRPLIILLFCAAMASAQSTGEAVPQPSTTLSSQFFEHDFVNVFAFGSGVYDTALPILTPSGSHYGSSYGYDVGGGITIGHAVKGGNFSLSYKGDYRHYEAATYSNGNNQNLSLLFTTRLNRQWSLFAQAGGGIVEYGGESFSQSAGFGGNVLTNPLSSQSRFANGGLTLTYEQTKRLSYSFGGQGFYNSYNYAGAISSKGGTGTASLNYRTTAHATVGLSYSHSYFAYSGNVGTTDVDSGFLTFQYAFSRHWSTSLSAGASRAHTKGIISVPVTILLDQQLVNGYITGPYNHTTISPSYQGSITRNLHRSYLSLTGGQGINAGNGTILASKNLFGSATFSVTHHLSNFSFSGGYSRLTSISNTVSDRYSSASASVSYGFNIVRYLSGNVRYDFTHYDGLYYLRGVNESRITLGLSFSSKSIPLTLF